MGLISFGCGWGSGLWFLDEQREREIIWGEGSRWIGQNNVEGQGGEETFD